jgi:hypothetical protein
MVEKIVKCLRIPDGLVISQGFISTALFVVKDMAGYFANKKIAAAPRIFSGV